MAAEPNIHQRAAWIRRHLTPPEARLWRCLRGRRLGGLKFRRQHPIGSYILDFYCPGARLCVEVDGARHETPEQLAHDRKRTAWLEAQGMRVIRYSAMAIRDDLDGVLAGIRAAASGR